MIDGESDRITEVLARAWVVCDPNRFPNDPDAIMGEGEFAGGKSADCFGKPKWMWFIPRAQAMRDFLSDNGLVIRPKDTAK